MNRTIGAVSSTVNLLAVLGFAACMMFGFDSGSYFCPVAVLSRRYFQSITGRSSP